LLASTLFRGVDVVQKNRARPIAAAVVSFWACQWILFMLCSYHERLRRAGVASCGSRSRSKRASAGQKFVVRCNSEIAGSRIVEERPAKGATAARRTAEILASTLNVTATVYGTDAEGEFVYGVYEVAEGAATASSPLIRQLFAESAAASLALKDQLLANIPEDTIKGFASMAASLGYIVAQHKQIKRAAAPQISYSTLFRIFCGAGDPSIISLLSDDATIAILTQKLCDKPDWMWLSELSGVGVADRSIVMPNIRPSKVTLNIDGELKVLRPRTVSDVPLSVSTWRPHAEGLREEASRLGLQFDEGVTTDEARVLRVPGTFNYKTTPPRACRLASLGRPMILQWTWAALQPSRQRKRSLPRQ
jgi:hypothetical protein